MGSYMSAYLPRALLDWAAAICTFATSRTSTMGMPAQVAREVTACELHCTKAKALVQLCVVPLPGSIGNAPVISFATIMELSDGVRTAANPGRKGPITSGGWMVIRSKPQGSRFWDTIASRVRWMKEARPCQQLLTMNSQHAASDFTLLTAYAWCKPLDTLRCKNRHNAYTHALLG